MKRIKKEDFIKIAEKCYNEQQSLLFISGNAKEIGLGLWEMPVRLKNRIVIIDEGKIVSK